MTVARLTRAQIRELRRQLAQGLITVEEAQEHGFPPSDPIKEKR